MEVAAPVFKSKLSVKDTSTVVALTKVRLEMPNPPQPPPPLKLIYLLPVKAVIVGELAEVAMPLAAILI